MTTSSIILTGFPYKGRMIILLLSIHKLGILMHCKVMDNNVFLIRVHSQIVLHLQVKCLLVRRKESLGFENSEGGCCVLYDE
jgi:hypothetical protein